MPDSEIASTFLNTRIPASLKERVVREAEKNGVTPSHFIKKVLNQKFSNDPDGEAVVSRAEDLSEGWEDLLGQVLELHRKRDGLVAMIQAKEGLFSDAPESLRIALRVCDRKITDIGGQLEKYLPQESPGGKSFLDGILNFGF